ncbi:MAG: DNA repair protein RecN [Clostridia bacterium]|nr:DNA repair protein RecN [Clostridia bacterium]
MLDTLHIENIAVVKEADIDIGPGFTVLTGETGAGKSIIIDAINLLLGARPNREMIRAGEDTAVASAVFSSVPAAVLAAMSDMGIRVEEDGSLFLQRSVSEMGKAVTRIGGRPISVSAQKELIGQLIAIHGQHENQLFLDPDTHIGYLDDYIELEGPLKAYQELYRSYSEIRQKMRALQKDDQEKTRLSDLLRYQISDIDAGKLKVGEEEQLLEKRIKIRNAEKITKQVNTVYASLRGGDSHSVVEQLDRAISSLDRISEYVPEAAGFSEKLSEYRYEIEDIAETVISYVDDETADPTKLLDKIETRLDAIARLKKKYGATVEDVIAFRERAAAELADLISSEEKIAELDTARKQIYLQLKEAAEVLTAKRIEGGKQLSEKIMHELAFLDMEKVRFAVSVKPSISAEGGETVKTYHTRGCDRVEFLISTNPGEPLKPLEKIASGGELSRIMLAAKCVTAGTESLGTMIFDEVDTGVSGGTSQKIGRKLKELGKSGCQVICVTHSAQIAALADTHLFISKHETDGRVETVVTVLDHDGRVEELSRIIGGLEITDGIRTTAEEMLLAGQKM